MCGVGLGGINVANSVTVSKDGGGLIRVVNSMPTPLEFIPVQLESLAGLSSTELSQWEAFNLDAPFSQPPPLPWENLTVAALHGASCDGHFSFLDLDAPAHTLLQSRSRSTPPVFNAHTHTFTHRRPHKEVELMAWRATQDVEVNDRDARMDCHCVFMLMSHFT